MSYNSTHHIFTTMTKSHTNVSRACINLKSARTNSNKGMMQANPITTTMSQRYWRLVFFVAIICKSLCIFTTRVLYFTKTHLSRNNMEIHLTFTQNVFHFQNIKKLFHAPKIYQRPTRFQETEYGHKLNELVVFLISSTITSHHFSSNILTLASPQPFILGMLTINKHNILPHNKSRMCNLALLPTCMFLQIVKLKNNSFEPSHRAHCKSCSASHPTIASAHLVIL